jgi:hypothetical protein
MGIKKILRNILIEHIEKDSIEKIDEDDFLMQLDDLTTLDLEDDQVSTPDYNEDTDNFIDNFNGVYMHIRRRDEFPSAGPFELFLLDVNHNTIGFIRGTKSGKGIISFNLIFIDEENRGMGLGTEIYEYFLNKGFAIKSDSEITDSTNSLYRKLLSKGYQPVEYSYSGSVGFLPK